MADASYDFSGETVLVTGASRGIGRAVAAGFACGGADVTILADDEAVFDAASALASETGRPVAALQCDIADAEQVANALAGFERLDVLVNNAGLERITPLLEPGDAVAQTFRRIVDINVVGTFNVTRIAVPKMAAGGRIVFTGSIWSRTAVAEFSAYCATKHAVLGFMRSVAHEVAPLGIRANAVCPGWVRTEASMRSLDAMTERSGRDRQELLDEIVSAQVLDGLMEPPDVVDAFLFLASDASRSMTGQALDVDRGEVMA